MKLIDLQTLMDGDQQLNIQQHDGYCMSFVDILKVKDLDNSKLKDEEISLISGGFYNTICITLEGTYKEVN